MAGIYTSGEFLRSEEIRLHTGANGHGWFFLKLSKGDDTLLHVPGLDRGNLEALYASILATLMDADEADRERLSDTEIINRRYDELTMPDTGNPVG